MAAITTGVSFDTTSAVFEPPHKNQCTGNEARQIVAGINASTPTLEQSMADIKAAMDLMSNTADHGFLHIVRKHARLVKFSSQHCFFSQKLR